MTTKTVKRGLALAASLLWLPAVHAAPSFPEQEEVCSFDAGREVSRTLSALNFPTPVASSMLVNGVQVWTAGPTAVPTIKPGDVVTLRGSGFGSGTDVDFSKIMIGNSRILETDLKMYNQMLDIVAQVNYETSFTHSTWPNATNHMPIRRSLSHTESYVGFEGSYIHSEEPDGAMGSTPSWGSR